MVFKGLRSLHILYSVSHNILYTLSFSGVVVFKGLELSLRSLQGCQSDFPIHCPSDGPSSGHQHEIYNHKQIKWLLCCPHRLKHPAHTHPAHTLTSSNSNKKHLLRQLGLQEVHSMTNIIYSVMLLELCLAIFKCILTMRGGELAWWWWWSKPNGCINNFSSE